MRRFISLKHYGRLFSLAVSVLFLITNTSNVELVFQAIRLSFDL